MKTWIRWSLRGWCTVIVVGLCVPLVGCRKGGKSGSAPDPGITQAPDKRQEGDHSEQKKTEKVQPEPVKWDQPAGGGDSGSGVVLQIKRNPGRVRVYEGNIQRSQVGNNNYTETGNFYLTFFTVDQTPEGFNRMAIRRSFLTRSRKETLENGRKIDRILPNTDVIMNLGPNFDFVAGKRCYAFDPQNRVAYRSESLVIMRDSAYKRGIIVTQNESFIVLETSVGRERLARARILKIEKIPTPHLFRYDTPHYFFPILSRRAVRPGEQWRFKVPVIIPLDQSGKTSMMPTQFDVTITGRLREIVGTGTERAAVIDYQLTGLFDTTQEPFTQRYSKEFLDRNRVVHEVSGKGSLQLQLDKGLILNKQENLTIKLFASSVVNKPNNQGTKLNENRATIQSSFQMKWIKPGTRLRTGATVPQD